MKAERIFLLVLSLLALSAIYACDTLKESPPRIERENIKDCTVKTPEHIADMIPIKDLHIENATVHGQIDQFIDPCKNAGQAPLVLSDATRNTYRMTFELDANYPINSIEVLNYLDNDDYRLKNLTIETSVGGTTFKRVVDNEPMWGPELTPFTIKENARFVRLIFNSTPGTGNRSGPYFGLNNVRFILGAGHIIETSTYHTDPFFRMSGWTGADGIFSYNLSHGVNHIGADTDNIGFIFSDTFIGEVYEHNFLRHSHKLVNNTLAYHDPALSFKEGLEFVYHSDAAGNPGNVYDPGFYTGYHPSNLANGIGLTHTHRPTALLSTRGPGQMWRGADLAHDTITLDLKDIERLGSLYFWNDNEMPAHGIRHFDLYHGETRDDLRHFGTFELEKAPGEPTGPQSVSGEGSIDLAGIEARYLEIRITDNHEATPSAYGLGKVMLFDDNGAYIHASSSATGYDKTSDAIEESSRLWLQDSLVLGDYFYNFPILVKDEGAHFKVHKVGMSKTPIVDGVLDYENAIHMDTPLQVRTEDGGEIFYGAGVLNMANHSAVDDPYVYIYGYKDLDGRYLTVARVRPENIENFNRYEFFDGETFQSDIEQSAKGIREVSPELSVTHIPSGPYAGKYMLTVMYSTTSGRVAYALSDTPYGPFDEMRIIYVAPEPDELMAAFTYNAKMHPMLSEAGRYVISYNVNATRAIGLFNARVYYPRFIIMREVLE